MSYIFHPIELWNEGERLVISEASLGWRLFYIAVITLVSFNSLLFIVNSLPVPPCEGESILQTLILNEKIATIIGAFCVGLFLVLSQGCSFKMGVGMVGILFLLSLIDLIKERKKATIKVAFLM